MDKRQQDTHPKQTGESVSDVTKFLDSIVENIPDMIFVKDAEELRFVRFNRAGEDLLGYARKDLIGKNDYDFFPKEEADFFTSKDQEVLKNGTLLDIPQEPIQTAKKGLRLLHTKKIPINGPDGKPKYLLGISEDITEKKMLEEKILQQSRMATLGQMAAGIAHEIRNPLFGISSVAQILSDELPEDKKLNELFQLMLHEIDRLKKLLGDLLLYARPSRPKLQPVYLKNLWGEIETLHRQSIAEKKITLHVEFQNAEEEILTDSDQLRQVLTNLHLNALQTSPEGGTVTIKSRSTWNGDHGDWNLSIHNDGEPISPENMPRIFEPFFSTRKEGSGLGLAICRTIVRDLGGTIRAESTEASGTTFSITIPVSRTGRDHAL